MSTPSDVNIPSAVIGAVLGSVILALVAGIIIQVMRQRLHPNNLNKAMLHESQFYFNMCSFNNLIKLTNSF